MKVIFESTIKANEEGGWYIELKDTIDGKVAICKDLDEYEKKIIEFGENYGNQIDEVKWGQEENLHPHLLDEVRLAMSKFQEKYKDQIENENQR